MMVMKVVAYAHSDVGLVRQNNEDAWNQLPDLYFYVLADGMGGHQAGEVASKIAVTELCDIIKLEWQPFQTTLSQGKKFLYEAIERTNLIVYEKGQSDSQLQGMGTTLCALLFHPQGVIYAHVGDSRIYRFRNHYLEQLTQDHACFKEFRIQAQNGYSCFRHMLTQAIGTEPYIEPSVTINPWASEDIFLLCSDGLTDMLSNEEIQEIFRNTSFQLIVSQLINEAKKRGGHDNITALIVNVHEAHLS